MSTDEELHRIIDEVLHYIWDPIGISDEPGARTEYHSYVPEVLEILKNGGNEQLIANHLMSASLHRMGMGEQKARGV